MCVRLLLVPLTNGVVSSGVKSNYFFCKKQFFLKSLYASFPRSFLCAASFSLEIHNFKL
jgi:hypothetical protein